MIKNIAAMILAVCGVGIASYIKGRRNEKDKQINERNKEDIAKVRRSRGIKKKIDKMDSDQLTDEYSKLL